MPQQQGCKASAVHGLLAPPDGVYSSLLDVSFSWMKRLSWATASRYAARARSSWEPWQAYIGS